MHDHKIELTNLCRKQRVNRCDPQDVSAQPYPGDVDGSVRPHKPALVVWIEVYGHTTLYCFTTLHWWCGSIYTTTRLFLELCGSRCTTTHPCRGGVDRGVQPHEPILVMWIEVYDHQNLPWLCGSRCTTTQPCPTGVDRGVLLHNPSLVVWINIYDLEFCGSRCTTTQPYP